MSGYSAPHFTTSRHSSRIDDDLPVFGQVVLGCQACRRDMVARLGESPSPPRQIGPDRLRRRRRAGCAADLSDTVPRTGTGTNPGAREVNVLERRSACRDFAMLERILRRRGTRVHRKSNVPITTRQWLLSRCIQVTVLRVDAAPTWAGSRTPGSESSCFQWLRQ